MAIAAAVEEKPPKVLSREELFEQKRKEIVGFPETQAWLDKCNKEIQQFKSNKVSILMVPREARELRRRQNDDF